MSTDKIESWSQLVAYADEKINYPFEAFIEKRIVAADSVTDIVCAAVVIAEDLGDQPGESKNVLARRLLHAYLQTAQWNPFIRKIVDVALGIAIEGAVMALNLLLPSGWNNLLDLLFDDDPDLAGIVELLT